MLRRDAFSLEGFFRGRLGFLVVDVEVADPVRVEVEADVLDLIPQLIGHLYRDLAAFPPRQERSVSRAISMA